MALLPKLLQRVREALPASQRIYFIYTHRNGYDRFANGLRANTEISHFCYEALRRVFPATCFLRLEGEKERRIARIRPQDVVVGHIGETFAKACKRTRRTLIFYPWVGHEDRWQERFNCLPKEQELAYYKQAASLVFLTSEHNVREYVEKSGTFWHGYFQEWKKRASVRFVHQPIDTHLFKRIKWEYQTNDFLYIGNDAHMKGLPESKKLVKSVGRHLSLYGCEGKRLDNLDSAAVEQLSKEADFFIQVGLWEAQCVSILEAAARGFIPIVTKETGYPYDHPFLLHPLDFDHNLKVLRELLATPPSFRKELADHLYNQLVSDRNHNTWEELTKVLVEEACALL